MKNFITVVNDGKFDCYETREEAKNALISKDVIGFVAKILDRSEKNVGIQIIAVAQRIRKPKKSV